MTRLREVLVLEPGPTSARAARFQREGDGLRLVASIEAPGSTREAAARAALEQLAAPRQTPVCLLTLDVTPACLDLPATAGSLPPERLAELVRWEIEPLVPGSGDLASGLSPRSARGPDGARRLALGIRKHAIAVWTAALPGARLHALYPRGLGALPLVDPRRGGVLLEVRADAGSSAVLDGGAVQSVRIRELLTGPGLTPDQLLGLVGADARAIHLAVPLATELREGLERAGYELLSLPEHAPLEGVARHALGLAGADALAAIPAREPGPPLHSQTWARIAAGGLALALAVALIDVVHYRSNQRNVQEAIRALEHRPRPAVAPAGPTEPRSEIQAAVARLEKQDAALARTHDRLENEIVANESLPLAVLDGLVRATDDEVSIERLGQTAPGQWLLTGFGLTEVGVQRFAVALDHELAGAGMAAELLGEHGDRGRLGIAGWSFELQVHHVAVGAPGALPASTAPTATRRSGRGH